MRGRLESLRGAACVLLVLYHVVGIDSGSGLRIGEGWLRVTNDWLALLRMPLFGLIAGWFYAERPVGGGQVGAFLRGKAERLLLPSLTVGTLYLLAQAFVPGVNNPSTGVPLLIPVAHLWFIQALFLVFVVVASAECAGLLRTLNRMYLVLAGAAAIYVSGVGTPWLGVSGALYLLPYVLLGIGLRRFGEIGRLQDPVCVILLLSAVWALANAVEIDVLTERRSVAYLATATCLILLALASGLRSELLIRVGGHSYAIFLFHAFFAAGSRIVLERAGVSSVSALLPLCLAAAVLGPILLHPLLAAHRLTAALFLGAGWPRSAPDKQTAERFRPAATIADKSLA